MNKMKENNPKVSIIVPVYNVPEQYLRKCVETLVNQTLKEIEIILVDDGTYETSGKICDELALTDNRIKVIHQENKGLCGARNTGAKAAAGDWIAYVDGDDFVELDTYETLYNEANVEEDIDVVMFSYIKDYPSRSVVMNYDKYLESGKVYQTKEELRYLQSMILNYNANIAMAPTKFMRHDFVRANDIYHDEILRQGAEGIEFNVRLMASAKKVKFIEKHFYHYIYNDESITTKHNEKNHLMVLGCFEKIKKEIDNNDKELMDWFYDRMNNVILTTAISGYFSPSNPEKYSVKKKKYKEYLKNDIVKETLSKKVNKTLDFTRRVTLICIKLHLFMLVNLISKIRVKQKSK